MSSALVQMLKPLRGMRVLWLFDASPAPQGIQDTLPRRVFPRLNQSPGHCDQVPWDAIKR